MLSFYVGGPMTGLPEFNFPAFDDAKQLLQELGHKVVTPADIDRSYGFDGTTNANISPEFLQKVFMADLEAVANADALYMLRGWENSRGAFVEWSLGRYLGKKFFYQGDKS